MIHTKGRTRLLALVAASCAAAIALTGCGGGSPTSTDSATAGATDTATTEPGTGDTGAATGTDTDRPMIIWAGSQTPITPNFNPYAPTVVHGALGALYETLFAYNKAAATDPIPMLGESFTWNDDGTELTVKLRQGVKWNDGTDFTTDDVIWSFTNEAYKPSYMKDATAPDASTVVLTFTEPSFTNEFQLLGSTYMLPKAVFSTQKDVVTFENSDKPVGTGPYTLETSTDASYTMVANPTYWGGEAKVKKLKYIGIDANQSAEDLVKTGQIDWTGMFIPDPDAITASGAVGYINTPQDPTVLYTCSNADMGCEGPQTDVAVRQALNLAIDRTSINDKAFVGLAAKISPTFALLGRDDAWIADGMPAESPQTADVAAATKVLEDAGYAKGSDGIYAKDGKKVEMTLTSVDGWSDYNSACEQIAEQVGKAGIKLNVSTLSWDAFSDGRQTGQYQLIMGGVVGTSVPDPFQIYHDWFTTDSTMKVGEQLKAGTWNFSRYSDKDVDAAVVEAASTNDEATKKAAYAKIQAKIVNDLPYIPIVINATQTFYNIKDYTGWPTESDLYAFPPAWGAVSSGVVLNHLSGTGN